MAMTFDATLKEMGRESPEGFLTVFDRAPTLPIRLLNVDLSIVTSATDLVLGLGQPLEEIIHFEFQSGAAAWKHADLMVYNSLLYAQHHVPAHTILVLLRPQAAHSKLTGSVGYAPRPEHGRMDFKYEIVRLWELPAEELMASDVGIAPLAMLGRLPEGTSREDALTSVAQRIVERLTKEAPPDRAKRLLTDALLLTGLRVRRELALKIFRGVRLMQESDTYLMILEEGEAKAARDFILLSGEEKFGAPPEPAMEQLNAVTDFERLKRMFRRIGSATDWHEILDTP